MIAREMKRVICSVLHRIEEKDWDQTAVNALSDYPEDMVLNNSEKWQIIWRVKEDMGLDADSQYDFERFIRREIWI